MSDATADLIWPYATTLVLAAETPGQRRWALDTAIELVRKLAKQRPKVIVVDLLSQDDASVASTLGVETGQGIVEILFQGATFSSVARRPEGEPFYFLTTGSAPPPRQVLFKHPRWKKISDKLADAGAHLLLCVTADDWLDSGPVPGFEACLLLNASGREVELPSDGRRLAEFLAPPEVRGEAESVRSLPWTAPQGAAPPREAEIPVEATVAEPTAAEPTYAEPTPVDASAQEPTDLAPALPEDGYSEPPFASASARSNMPVSAAARLRRFIPRAIPGDRRRTAALGAVAVVALLALVVWRVLPGRGHVGEPDDLEAAAETAAVETAATAESAVPQVEVEPEPTAQPVAPDPMPRPEDIELPYSVLIASFSAFDDAVSRQRDWVRRDLPVYVAPTPVRGVIYYRVFAGLLPERQQALDLMARLVRDGMKESVNDWDVRPARLALWFGTYPTADDAEAVVKTLAGGGVPGYVVPATARAGGGSQAYHVYAGGYETPEDAAPLEERVTKAGFAGLDARLIERVGLGTQ